jgi:uncharacterized membrane protein
MNRDEAQRSVDRIGVFLAELEGLEREGVLVLPAEERQRVREHFDARIARLSAEFDVDSSSMEKQMSMGMRIVSFLGALALSAAVFFFFYRFWGLLSTPLQVTILIAAPVAATAGIDLAARREKTLYFASLIGLVAFAAFVLDLSMLGQIFAITPTQNAFLVWGAFGLIIAYTYRLRLLLTAGIAGLMAYLSATVGTWRGCYWLSFGERPENFLFAGAVVAAAAALPHRGREEFAPVYRIFGLLVLLSASLILSHWGAGSYLSLPVKTVENGYQVAGFVLSAAVIWGGIRRHWPGTVNLGSTFFVIFLYTKLFDWWWDWMPKYLFFLLLGLMAVGLLLVLRRMRTSLKGGVA